MTGDAPVSASNGLTLSLVELADRHGHRVSVEVDGQTITLLESIEGDARQAWPPSPALQTWHAEQLPDGRTALLLVGMAGRNHWSASYETRVDGLAIDMACRAGAAPEFLGTTWSLDPLASVRLETDKAAEIRVGERRWRIEAEHGRLALESGALQLVPTEIAKSGPARWSARILSNADR